MSVFGCSADYGSTIDCDVDGATFRKIMCFVYKEDISIRSIEEATNLLYNAGKYKISALDKQCEKFLMKILSQENVQEITTIAETYNLPALKRMCKLFLSKVNTEISSSWVRFDQNQLADGVIIAAYSLDGSPICIGRCIYEGNILPGPVDIGDETIMITFEGSTVKMKKYEMLCNGNLYWSKSNSGNQILSDAVLGGTSEHGETLYIGRVMHEGVLKVGKVINDSLFVADGKKEIKIEENYEILVEKPICIKNQTSNSI